MHTMVHMKIAVSVFVSLQLFVWPSASIRMNPPGWEDSDSSDSDGTDGSGDFQVGNEHAAQMS